MAGKGRGEEGREGSLIYVCISRSNALCSSADLDHKQ
jgi:hypothetical protein